MNVIEIEDSQKIGIQAKELAGNRALNRALTSIKDDAIRRLNMTPTVETDQIKDAVRVLQIVEGFVLAIKSVENDGIIAAEYIKRMYEAMPTNRKLDRG